MLAILGFSVLILAASLRVWAVLSLLQGYRPAEYLTDPRARRRYILAWVAFPFMMLGLLLAAYASSIWWVVVGVWLFVLLATWAAAWKLRLRFFGDWQSFYRRHQWS